MKNTLRWICCHILHEHQLTSKALDDPGLVPDHLKPKKDDLPEMVMQKFREYARIYCRHCGKNSRLTP